MFSEVQGDQCLDGSCYQIKVDAHLDGEMEHTDNPDAEPVTLCEAVKPAIIVYGKRSNHSHGSH